MLNDLLKLKTELYKTKEFTKSELNEFIIFSIKETESDLCWLAINSPKETNIAYGLNQIRSKQKTLSEIIAMENTIERFRQSLINKEIKKGYKVGNNELANETKLIKKKLSELLKYKKEINDTTNFNKDRYDKTVLRINEIFRKN